MNLSRLLLTLGVLTLAVPTIAQAQSKPDLQAARTSFKAGQEFMQMDRYADAVVEFRKAYEITKDKLVMGQVALAYEKGGDYEAALASIKIYRGALPRSEHRAVDAMMARFRKRIAQGRSKKLVLSTDQKANPATPADLQIEDEQTTAASPAKRKRKMWTWVAAGSAGAFAVGALVVGLNAQSKFDDLNQICGPDTTGVCDPGEVDSVRTRAKIADVLWGAAITSLVGATVLFFLEGGLSKRVAVVEEDSDDGSDQSEEDLDLDLDEDEATVKRLEIRPLIGPSQIGFGAILRY